MKLKSPYTEKEYEWTRPPRSVHWGHGRIVTTYQEKVREIVDGDDNADDNQRGMLLLERMTADERLRFEAYINDVLSAGLGKGIDVTDPAQVPEADYWWLFGTAIYTNPDAKVELEDGGELTAEQLGKFPEDGGAEERGVLADGAVVPGVRRKTISAAGVN